MNIYVYGTGKIGSKIEERLAQYNLELTGYIDSYKTGKFKDKPIVKAGNLSADDYVIISVLNTSSIMDIYSTLRDCGIKNIYWYYDALCSWDENNRKDFFREQCHDLTNWGRLIMPHIELHISDKCNLNCKGCSHFSPLYDEINAVYEDKLSDIRKIKALFDNIFRIDILGGEPLLNHELSKYIIGLREELPDTFIQIYTNGLLLPGLDDSVMQLIHDNNIGVSISEYAPTHKMIDKITDRLNQFQIRYHIAEYDDKQVFNTPISTSPDSKYPKMCISDGCITVDNGRISRCPTLMYISKFNEYFNQNLPTDGIYNIDDYSDGYMILEDMKKDIPLCKHCIKCDMKWSVCGAKKNIEDFAVNE